MRNNIVVGLTLVLTIAALIDGGIFAGIFVFIIGSLFTKPDKDDSTRKANDTVSQHKLERLRVVSEESGESDPVLENGVKVIDCLMSMTQKERDSMPNHLKEETMDILDDLEIQYSDDGLKLKRLQEELYMLEEALRQLKDEEQGEKQYGK